MAAASSPPAFIIPSSREDQRLLQQSSLAYAVPRASFASSQRAYHQLAPAETHAISLSDIANWRNQHPTERLRPPVGGATMADKATLTGYRPPQHPASHVLHSIPPRAPSRSSRSNILSYTLHLATSSRLSSYNSPSGSRSLLYLAEAERDQGDDIASVDDAWFDAEQKTQGLWKLGANLLQSARKGDALPPSVERRVGLAGLTEDLLVSPAPDRAVTKIDADAVQPCSAVDELVLLTPLTAPDSTTLYHTTSATTTLGSGVDSAGSAKSEGAGASGRPRVHSVAQSLIDLKFGGKADPSEAVSPSLPDNKPLPSLAGVDDASASSSAAAAGPSSLPHMDYRIVLSQSMRTRARSIFATSPLPALTTSYCRAHRVPSCGVCAAIVATASERESDHAKRRRVNVPGAGLRFIPSSSSPSSAQGAAKKPLVALVPDFLKVSAALLRDVQERANRPLNDLSGVGAGAIDDLFTAAAEVVSPSEKGKEKEPSVGLNVTAPWFDLLTSLLVQACLEGYLVDGWTGTEGVETLFGVGCGVWEGRAWGSSASATLPRAAVPVRIKEEEQSESEESEDEEEAQLRREKEEKEFKRRKDETRALVEAARALFGSRDVAQADYERGMRDRTHEFLNVPQNKSLHQHLDALSVKYPLSQFEDAMVDFIEAAVRLLGKPALAKYDPSASSAAPSSPSPSHTSTADSTPDPYALVRYFAPQSFATVSPPSVVSPPSDTESWERSRERRPHRAWEEGHGEVKRRRVD
ncbi:hypothetical protein JCM8097_001665 [Rhodosporidiobolus ruineniae]